MSVKGSISGASANIYKNYDGLCLKYNWISRRYIYNYWQGA
jgi:hypothetical protein